jgi:hypothetical protein
MSKVKFIWDGKEYEVGQEVGGKTHIVLPNRKVLQPHVWWCGMNGPAILHLKEIQHHLEHAPLGEIAEHFNNAALAHEVD